MQTFVAQLHGVFGWVLAAQILVVTGLSLLAIYMMIKRIYGRASDGHASTGGHEVSLMDEGALCPVGVSVHEIEGWKAKVQALENENVKMQAMRQDYETLQQKVKFLESKLLEYEILQEEIGTLSTLKVENEKLKKEIVSLESEIGKSQKVAEAVLASSEAIMAAPVMAPTIAAPMPEAQAPSAPVAVDLPTDLPIIPPLPELPLDLPDVPDMPTAVPVEFTPEPAVESAKIDMSTTVDRALAALEDPAPSSAAAEAAPSAGLDSLLSEIEELSSDDKKA